MFVVTVLCGLCCWCDFGSFVVLVCFVVCELFFSVMCYVSFVLCCRCVFA